MKPFADDSSAVTVGDLSIENGPDTIALHGSLDVTRDRKGLKAAQSLKQQVDAIVAALEAATDLPDELPAVVAFSKTFPNPF